MTVFQIIYLTINIIGVIASLIWFIGEIDYPVISNIFTALSRHLGNIGLTIIGTLLIILFIPTISLMSVIMAFIMLVGTYSN